MEAPDRQPTRRLARRHYENFTVASLLLPRRLRRQDPVAGRVKLSRLDVAGAMAGAVRYW